MLTNLFKTLGITAGVERVFDTPHAVAHAIVTLKNELLAKGYTVVKEVIAEGKLICHLDGQHGPVTITQAPAAQSMTVTTPEPAATTTDTANKTA